MNKNKSMEKEQAAPKKEALTEFARDVDIGLSAPQKYLLSKYFYSDVGDKIFQSIMAMEEYYLTDCEYEILSMNKDKMLRMFSEGGQSFKLIEFGAGDGYKTKVLLKHFEEQKAKYKYLPIDISADVLQSLEKDLKEKFPGIAVETVNDDYFKALEKMHKRDNKRKVILFMGSNIGNFIEERAIEFLKGFQDKLSKDDLLVIGFDLKKDPRVIKAAYDDKHGITKAFNLNLLLRINEELGGNFDVSKFTHFPFYNPLTGEMKSYLISQKEQKVAIEATGKTYEFDQWEPIFMEVSHKYDLKMIENLAEQSGFEVVHNFFDCKHYFVDSVWRKKTERG